MITAEVLSASVAHQRGGGALLQIHTGQFALKLKIGARLAEQIGGQLVARAPAAPGEHRNLTQAAAVGAPLPRPGEMASASSGL